MTSLDVVSAEFRPLVDNMLTALLEDFRYSEAIARQAGTLLSRKEAKAGRRLVVDRGPIDV